MPGDLESEGPGPARPRSTSPAVDLLLCCARTRLDQQTAERVRRLASGPLSWMEFVRLARSHDVLNLAYRSLRAACPEAVPPAIREQLNRYARRCGARNRNLAGRLIGLLALLDAHAIPAVPLKGPVLAAAVYGDLCLREFLDLDILIHERDALRAKSLFLAAGYEVRTKLDARGRPTEPGEYEYTFTHRADRHSAELCWRITPEGFLGSLDLASLGERRQPVRLAGAWVADLPPEERLLTLCVHGSKHCWASLRWICDVAEAVRACPNLNWHRVRALAKPSGCWRAVALGLLLAHDLLGAPLPDAIRSEVRHDAGAGRLAAWVRTWLFRVDGDPSADQPALWRSLKADWARRRYLLRLAERAPDRLWNCVLLALRPCARLLVPTEKDRRLLPLPGPFGFLYSPLRAARLAVRYGLSPAAKRLLAMRKPRPGAGGSQ